MLLIAFLAVVDHRRVFRALCPRSLHTGDRTPALCLYRGFLLLAGGSGVIKPEHLHADGPKTYDQQRPGNESLRISAAIPLPRFISAINVGAVISTFALPPIRTEAYGYAMATFQFSCLAHGGFIACDIRCRQAVLCHGNSRLTKKDSGRIEIYVMANAMAAIRHCMLGLWFSGGCGL